MYETEKLKVLNQILGESHTAGEENLFYCPSCNHHKRKLSLNLKKNAWHCWICEFRGNNITRLVKRYGSFLQRQEWEGFCSGYVVDTTFDDIIFSLREEKKQEKEEQKIKLPDTFISLCNNNLPLSAREPRTYLQGRGVNQNDILKWKIGYCKSGEYAGRIIIPSFDLDGDVNYFVSRAYSKQYWPAYKNPPVNRDIIFNELYVDFKNDLVVVEGVFDAIVCENSVPLLGSTLNENSKLFSKIVEMDTTVYIALDPDAERKAMGLIKNLLLYGVEVYKIDVAGYKDVGEMTRTEFKKRKVDAKKITNENYLFTTVTNFYLA